MLGARIEMEQSSPVKNESHLLALKSLVFGSRLVKKSSRGSRTSSQHQVGIAENFGDHFGVGKRKGLGTDGLEPSSGQRSSPASWTS